MKPTKMKPIPRKDNPSSQQGIRYVLSVFSYAQSVGFFKAFSNCPNRNELQESIKQDDAFIEAARVEREAREANMSKVAAELNFGP